MGLQEAREALAQAASTAGVQCVAYPPDNPAPPLAWVDSLGIDFAADVLYGRTFCRPGMCSATVVSIAQRHDREGAIQLLEGQLPDLLDSLATLPGVQLRSATSGAVSIGGQDLPAVFATVQFPI